MSTTRQLPLRAGATVVECAFVLPLTFFLLLALVVGAMGVFRYQEVASLAREGARYASTHGYQYRKDANLPTGTEEDWRTDIYNNAIAPRMVALDPNQLRLSDKWVEWPPVTNQPDKPDNWPGSKVEVTIEYDWLPELYLIGPIRLTSKSSMPITN